MNEIPFQTFALIKVVEPRRSSTILPTLWEYSPFVSRSFQALRSHRVRTRPLRFPGEAGGEGEGDKGAEQCGLHHRLARLHRLPGSHAGADSAPNANDRPEAEKMWGRVGRWEPEQARWHKKLMPTSGF